MSSFVWGLILVLILPLLSSLVLIFAIRRKRYWVILPFLLILLIWALMGVNFMAHNMGGGFGPATILSLLSVPGQCTTLIILILGGLSTRRIIKARDANWQKDFRFYLLGAGLIFLLPLIPPIGGSLLRSNCDAQNRDIAQGLIEAIERYTQDQGQRPQSLDDLKPDYASEFPSLSCLEQNESAVPSSPTNFDLVHCSADITLLVIPDMAGGWPQRYNFATQTWSQISFLDGVCNFLDEDSHPK